jgi:chemotaxis protein MotB
MKKNLYYLVAILCMISLSMTSCVSSKKFKASEARCNQLQKEKSATQGQLTDCNSRVKDLTDQKNTLLSENSSFQNDLKALSAISKLTIADQAKRLKRLQDMIQAQRDVMTRLKNSIAEAMMTYKTDELNVYIKDGNVYVSLSEKLLFKSGSDVVDPKGKEALKSLSLVINNTQDISVMIEGHTDNGPIRTRLFKDNWDLSTARASSIVRILTLDNGFDPNRISASGRSQYHPIQPNEATEGRAANRRTEIILSPDLKEIYKLLEQ